MAKRYKTTNIRITEVERGFELAIPSEGDSPPRRFVVDDIGVTHQKAAGEAPKLTLTSNLPDGWKWTIDFAHDAVVVRILGVEGDGT
jgi:hypothetical protein